MSETVQARLDPESQVALRKLMRRFGWNSSQVVREGLKLMAATYGATPKKKIIGMGEFDAGVPDLGTNKKYMEGFGK